ncbi:hypothetical protein FACS1894188_04870 [Clostridia bacterium]|nr:hypothetical protein FACS1894188_04870 [Clostridia bacterium]
MKKLLSFIIVISIFAVSSLQVLALDGEDESVEMSAHMITDIYVGQLSGVNAVQKKLILKNVRTLKQTGWENYKQAETFNLAGNDIEYYNDDKQISLDYAFKYFNRSSNEVYIALENHYSGKKVKKVTFRSEKDRMLPVETIIQSDSNGNFAMVSNSLNQISAGAGTIVVKNGFLVSPRLIANSDYAIVSLNGADKAAVVDIIDAPDVSQIVVARARVISVDDTLTPEEFRVQSMSILSNAHDRWNFTPIARYFDIDYNTLFISDMGDIGFQNFVGYTDKTDTRPNAISTINKAYTVLIDGSRAAAIIDAPYATEEVRGTIYDIIDDVIYLKNASYRNPTTGVWARISSPLGTVDETIQINVAPNTLVAKNNKRVDIDRLQIGADKLELGDKIHVLTDKLPTPLPLKSGAEINGYLVFVE